ncbi:MAG: gluconate 2-dehydrogenase subunit 3 family protein, partial [Actinomycetota bacterium]|nr:gluconate 2-dehydrogenase subunit 3 family protein [Actinomycetota bacterium]
LWLRYACTAFYAHPWSWNEIGFGGPAYPRGYKNLGVNRREPWEVADADGGDPLRGS